LKVFVVDDSAIVRERLTTMLSEIEGIEIVGQAQDAPEATRLLRKLRPDAVILDIRLPNGSGIEVLRAIKQQQPTLVAIMLTLYPYAQYRESCAKAGANFFFDKSTGFEKIPEVLKDLTRKPAGELTQ
jgi:DNA-binding NarL/FixJ family response regulator